MKTRDLNPFRPTRWEHQRRGHHLIWYPQTADLLTSDKSVYVRGSRGSGKTTLLRSICWEDLTRNPSLCLQRELTDFDYIGVYIKFPDHVSASLSGSNWGTIYPSSPDPLFEFHRFFSLAVELVSLERCLTACHDLRIAGHLNFSPSDEIAIIAATLDEFPKLAEFGGRPTTFLTFAQTCRTIVREMNQACGRGTIAEIGERLPPREAGELLNFMAAKIADIARLAGAPEREIGFKLCLDDCEVLSALQQRSLNTLVRISRHPISWVVSSVGSFFETSETFIEQQPLTDHDRKIERLDLRTPEEFQRLCQAVLSLRIYFSVNEAARNAYSGKIEDFFPLQARLGTRDINDLFDALLRDSESPVAIRVRRVAAELRSALQGKFKAFRRRFPPGSKSYPYYQAYILLLAKGEEDAFKNDFDEADEARVPELAHRFADGAFVAWLRRKQSAALLHLASRLGFKRLSYGGLPMISMLADGSVRDFLEVIGEIFDAYCRDNKISQDSERALERFALSRTQMGMPAQERGIYAASTSYLSGISNRTELDISIVTRFIDGLGHFTSSLQWNWRDPTTLGRAERGVFTVRFPERGRQGSLPERSVEEELVWNVIRQAELAGYIRTSAINLGAGVRANESDLRTVKFRLHHRFAPHYRFSHRGAYETVALHVDDLLQLLNRSPQIDPATWGDRLAARLRGEAPGQLDLDLSLPQDEEAEAEAVYE